MFKGAVGNGLQDHLVIGSLNLRLLLLREDAVLRVGDGQENTRCPGNRQLFARDSASDSAMASSAASSAFGLSVFSCSTSSLRRKLLGDVPGIEDRLHEVGLVAQRIPDYVQRADLLGKRVWSRPSARTTCPRVWDTDSRS